MKKQESEKTINKKRELLIITSFVVELCIVIGACVIGIFALAESELTDNMLTINTPTIQTQQVLNNTVTVPQQTIQQVQPTQPLQQESNTQLVQVPPNSDTTSETLSVFGYTETEIKEALMSIDAEIAYLAIDASRLENQVKLVEIDDAHTAKLIECINDTEIYMLKIYQKTFPIGDLEGIWSHCDYVRDLSQHWTVQALALQRQANRAVAQYEILCEKYGIPFDAPNG